VLGALMVDIALFNYDERNSDRDQRDREACGDPSADERHSAAEHEDYGGRQQNEISPGCLSELHLSHLLTVTWLSGGSLDVSAESRIQVEGSPHRLSENHPLEGDVAPAEACSVL
jgi:hypothetical protein